MIRLLTGHHHLKCIYLNWGWWTVLGAIDANRHLKGPSHAPCDCEALMVLRFMHLGHEFLKTGDFVDICVIKILPFVQSAGLPDA